MNQPCVTPLTERSRAVIYGTCPQRQRPTEDWDMRVLRHLHDQLGLADTTVDTSSQDQVLLATHLAERKHDPLDRLDLAGVTTDGSSEHHFHPGAHLFDLLNQHSEQGQLTGSLVEG